MAARERAQARVGQLREQFARLTPERVLALFVVFNFGFLGVDIAIAHRANGFAAPVEWAPLVFSGLAVPLLLVGVLGWSAPRFRTVIDLTVAAGAIVLGVAGMLFHLASGFFEAATLRNLVYAAPFVAPLSYVGVGLLQVLLRMEPEGSPAFGPAVLTLALGGAVGNLTLSLLDHAQNGFFSPYEWLPVVAAAFFASFLLLALLRPEPAFFRLCLWLCGLQAGVGVLGVGLHLNAELQVSAATMLDRLVYGAPLFAPLLFADIAVLAAIGLWASLRAL